MSPSPSPDAPQGRHNPQDNDNEQKAGLKVTPRNRLGGGEDCRARRLRVRDCLALVGRDGEGSEWLGLWNARTRQDESSERRRREVEGLRQGRGLRIPRCCAL